MSAISQIPAMFRTLDGGDYRDPIYVTRDGQPRFMIGGGSGEGDGGDAGAGDADGDAGKDAGDAGGDADKDAGADKGDADKDASKKDDADKSDKGKTFDETYVKKLRDEAAESRTEKQKLAGVLDAINKALNPDAKDEDKVDPAKLATDLTTERTAHTNLQREHQVLLTAISAGADHSALLDSRSFLAKVGELDPTADDFAGKVRAAVEAALKDNPKLKVGQAPAASSADHGGSGGDAPNSKTPKSLSAAVGGHYGT